MSVGTSIATGTVNQIAQFSMRESEGGENPTAPVAPSVVGGQTRDGEREVAALSAQVARASNSNDSGG